MVEYVEYMGIPRDIIICYILGCITAFIYARYPPPPKLEDDESGFFHLILSVLLAGILFSFPFIVIRMIIGII